MELVTYAFVLALPSILYVGIANIFNLAVRRARRDERG